MRSYSNMPAYIVADGIDQFDTTSRLSAARSNGPGQMTLPLFCKPRAEPDIARHGSRMFCESLWLEVCCIHRADFILGIVKFPSQGGSERALSTLQKPDARSFHTDPAGIPRFSCSRCTLTWEHFWTDRSQAKGEVQDGNRALSQSSPLSIPLGLPPAAVVSRH